MLVQGVGVFFCPVQNLSQFCGRKWENVCLLRVCSYKFQCLSSICARHSTYVDSHKNLARAAAWKLRPQTPHLLCGRAEIWFSLCSLSTVLKKRCFSLVFFKSTCCLFFLYFPMCIKRSRGHNMYCIFSCTPFQGEVLYHLYLSTFMPNHVLFHS